MGCRGNQVVRVPGRDGVEEMGGRGKSDGTGGDKSCKTAGRSTGRVAVELLQVHRHSLGTDDLEVGRILASVGVAVLARHQQRRPE